MKTASPLAWLSSLIVGWLFLLFSFPQHELTSFQQHIQTINQKTNFPPRQFIVKFEEVKILKNEGVGHDWHHFLVIKQDSLQIGEWIKLTLKDRKGLTFKAIAIEFDKDRPDKGEGQLKLNYSTLIAIKERGIAIELEVIENGGRNKGKKALLRYVFSIKQI